MRNIMCALSLRLPNLWQAHLQPPQEPADPVQAVPPLRPRIDIPVADPAPDVAAHDALRQRGRFLARQDAWDEIAELITQYDAERTLTPGLRPTAKLLVEGACSDILLAVRAGITRQEPNAAMTVMNALEFFLDDAPDDTAMGFVVASAHLAAALDWRGDNTLHALAPLRRRAYEAHMARVTELVDCFDPFEHDSALWAQMRCALLQADPHPAQRAADDYEDLIDLDPGCPCHLLALGRDMLPSRFGTWEALEREACRTAARLTDLWGAGGYAWVYMGALSHDAGALRQVDADLMIAGIHDIVARHSCQHMANRIAAFCGIVMADGNATRGSVVDRLQNCFAWIVQDHLRELHPHIWACAHKPDVKKASLDTMCNDELVRLGRTRALACLADFYAPALDAGRRMIFLPDGIQFKKGAA